MVADHSRAAEELKQAAGSLSVPSEPSAEQRAKLDALKGKVGSRVRPQLRERSRRLGARGSGSRCSTTTRGTAPTRTSRPMRARRCRRCASHLAMAKQMAAAVVASK
jgi:hypothetical protein